MKTAVLKPSSHQLISLAYYLSKQKKKIETNKQQKTLQVSLTSFKISSTHLLLQYSKTKYDCC